MKVVAIVQARMGSTRLPGKVMKKIVGKPVIELLLRRLDLSTEVDQIVVATSLDIKNMELKNHVNSLGFECHMGSEEDVLSRVHDTAKRFHADIVVRITGDCPLVDPALVDLIVREFKSLSVDYVSNINPPSYPDGLDIEIFDFSVLEKAFNEATTSFDREHVTPFIRNSALFKISNVELETDLSGLRWTLDEPMDFVVIDRVFNYFKPDIHFSWLDVLSLYDDHADLFSTNKEIVRNEGSKMGSGQKLWKRAKKVIPGGNMLLSKRPEMFLPDLWPSYFEKAKGCEVWDMDGNKYIDMSIMGIGTNILGYGHDEVDEAVLHAVQKGNMSTLNCPEEVYLAERLVEIHPWADMVRFARTGGEANAIAIRIARAATGKSNVAFCGYHGWHDWYLAANLSKSSGLDDQLLPGLEPNGVPKNLKDTVFPFEYNDYEGLKEIVEKHNIGVIKMEVIRNFGPQDDFLKKVRALATDRGAVLIFDECTSGFRETFGGIHKIYGVEPDIAMFGKAMGNGYAITATIGRREVMEAAQSSFISSTFWTERIGSCAALKALEVMEREKSWDIVTSIGGAMKTKWQLLADKFGLGITHFGINALAGFSFDSSNSLKYKTFITQEMLSRGYLASNSFYPSIQHTTDHIDGYFHNLEPVFKTIADCENGRDITTLLKTPECHSGFKRLN
ncbi:aminotransferase class III-fold pyridoxal phosphate-dependent enzyme [Gammaproteobacteria bacterium]|nr:aminotransferase class III-fold pyridoxal phosphate-dependent enzyme [Gammaproteobacteria bacterium]